MNYHRLVMGWMARRVADRLFQRGIEAGEVGLLAAGGALAALSGVLTKHPKMLTP